jgi:DNA-binding NtrC family response regulator
MPEATILLVEPDILARGPLADYLRACGYAVLEATGGEEARTILHQGIAVEIALIGAHKPATTDAFALAGWIRKEHPGTRVILAGTVAKAASAAGDLCEDGPTLSKPYDHSVVVDQIRRLMASRERSE